MGKLLLQTRSPEERDEAAGTPKHRHARTSSPRRSLSPGAVPASRPLCDTEQRPSSSLINLLMGNQKSVSQPADWRDELLEGTTDEMQKGWGRRAPRRNRTAAVPWIKLLARGRREDTEDNAPRAGAAPAQGEMLEQPPGQGGGICCLSRLDHPLTPVSIRAQALGQAAASVSKPPQPLPRIGSTAPPSWAGGAADTDGLNTISSPWCHWQIPPHVRTSDAKRFRDSDSEYPC